MSEIKRKNKVTYVKEYNEPEKELKSYLVYRSVLRNSQIITAPVENLNIK